MSKRYAPISAKCPHFLHGGDYNPDQWMRTPEVWDEDMRLMKLAHCNAMSIGIFSWAALEPEEGRFEFGWLDTMMDKLAAAGGFAVLATPSGSKPAWLSRTYPEVCRVDANGMRHHHQLRHNHCRTSPVYREKCQRINRLLAERYKDHPALLVWHVSNEYNGGDCQCDLCLGAFREWLKERYDHNLDKLNAAWWTGFWSHTYTDWNDIRPVDGSIHGLTLDWKRFLTHQTVDFFLAESAPLREVTPEIPVTTNLMGLYDGLDNWAVAKHLDVVSWDSYPRWHSPDGDVELAAEIAMVHDINRCMRGGQPFMLMESVPSATNWAPVCKLKRPGMHLLSSLQAVAHGSDTVQYFQWRKGQGGSEKFHGAVVDHVGHEHTRVFRDVAAVGQALEKLDGVIGTGVDAKAAVVLDWENRWALEAMQGLGHEHRKSSVQACLAHYRELWRRGIATDVIDQTAPLDGYRLLITPMLYLLRPGMAEKIRAFVEGGGTWVATYWTGIVDEHDLCFLGGFPGAGLREVLGIWDEEIDALYPGETMTVEFAGDNELGLAGTYEARELIGLIHAETADVLATYADGPWAGRPAVTVNGFGSGRAFYVASRNSAEFLDDLVGALAEKLELPRALPRLPEGISAQVRTDGETEYLFLMNFGEAPRLVSVGGGRNLLTGEEVSEQLELGAYGVAVVERPAG